MPRGSGFDLHVDIDPARVRQSVESSIRRAIDEGRLVAGTRLPSARTLAAALGDRLTGLVAPDGARRLSLDVLDANDSVALLTQLLGADRVRAESNAVAALARACAHLPLALRIAGARLADKQHRTIID